MFDSLFNFVIILIPLAIFIGRFVIQARNKNAPKPPQPHIPVHFEDDEDEEEEFSPYALSRGATEYFRGLSPAQKAAQPKPSRTSGKLGETLNQYGPGNLAASLASGQSYAPPASSGSLAPAPVRSPSAGSGSLASGQKDFFANLSKLPPLKQAVVMAEVLGPPKGII